MPPGQPFLHQLTPHIASVLQQHLGRHPALLVSREVSHDHVPVRNIGRSRVLRLFPVGLLQVGAIDVFQIDLGKRKNPFSVPNIRGVLLSVEPLSDTRTPLADFFSILLGG